MFIQYLARLKTIVTIKFWISLVCDIFYKCLTNHRGNYWYYIIHAPPWMMVSSIIRRNEGQSQPSGQLSDSYSGIPVLENWMKCNYIQWHHLLYHFFKCLDSHMQLRCNLSLSDFCRKMLYRKVKASFFIIFTCTYLINWCPVRRQLLSV